MGATIRKIGGNGNTIIKKGDTEGVVYYVKERSRPGVDRKHPFVTWTYVIKSPHIAQSPYYGNHFDSEEDAVYSCQQEVDKAEGW